MADETKLGPKALISLIPQKRPFLFVDEILAVDDKGIKAKYTFREDEYFFAGHFPDRPVAPGVILIESMAQVGVMALGIYLFAQDHPLENLSHYLPVFTEVESEFIKIVSPGDTVVINAEKLWWRRMKIKSKVEMRLEDGTLVARATLAGMGVQNG